MEILPITLEAIESIILKTVSFRNGFFMMNYAVESMRVTGKHIGLNILADGKVARTRIAGG